MATIAYNKQDNKRASWYNVNKGEKHKDSKYKKVRKRNAENRGRIRDFR